MRRIIYLLLFSPLFISAQETQEKYAPQHALIQNARKGGGGLSGQFTIGGTSPDFMTFTDAFDSLSLVGVSGPVEFLVRTGTYTETPVLNVVAGTSPVNTVIFRSETLDSADVILTSPSSTSTTNNYTMLINGADYITFSNMTFERSGVETNSTVVELANEADNISFINNRFMGPNALTTTNTTGTRSGIFSADIASNDSLVVRGNIFIDNANGLWVSGNSTSISTYTTGNVVEDNIFSTFYVGLFLLNQQAPVVRNNIITRNNTSATPDFFGISIRYCTGSLIISKNRIQTHTGSYGIRLRSSNGFFVAPGITSNNFIQVGDATTGRGIAVEENSLHQVIAHNSVNYDLPNTTGRAISVDGSGTGNIKILNNILSNSGGGYAAYVSAAASTGVSESNNNCFYSTGTNLAYYGTALVTLAQWQVASGKDAASVTGNPNFMSAVDLHVNSAFLDNAGTPSAGIADDIDGEARSLTTPDIGADEFVFSGVAEIAQSPVSIYPNPFRTDAMMVINDNNEYIFTLTDIKGKEVAKTKVKSKYIINRTGLKAGMYLYSIKHEENTWSGKIEIVD